MLELGSLTPSCYCYSNYISCRFISRPNSRCCFSTQSPKWLGNSTSERPASSVYVGLSSEDVGGVLLIVLLLRELRGAAAKNRVFSVVAPILWNSFPFELRTVSSLLTFQWA